MFVLSIATFTFTFTFTLTFTKFRDLGLRMTKEITDHVPLIVQAVQ